MVAGEKPNEPKTSILGKHKYKQAISLHSSDAILGVAKYRKLTGGKNPSGYKRQRENRDRGDTKALKVQEPHIKKMQEQE